MLLRCAGSRVWIPRPSRRLYSSLGRGSSGHEECDVVIVGGGPAGLAFASALVTLVEGGDLGKVRAWEMPPNAYSNRVVSLTNASQDFLNEIGAWDHVDTDRTCPIEDMQVWDGISDARIDFNAAALGLETLNLQRGLLRHLSGQSNIILLDSTKVENISNDDIPGGGWPMVGADGINSQFAHIPNRLYGWDYDTRAIVATLLHPPRTFPSNTTAYQRFLPTGPIAFLPLSPTASSLVWSTTPALAAVLTSRPRDSRRHDQRGIPPSRTVHPFPPWRLLEQPSLTPEDLRADIAFREQAHAIAPHSAHASATVDPEHASVGIPPHGSDALPPLVASIQPGTIASFPLRFRHAEEYIGSRTVLIGDAAHVIHPLAGQGLNLGLGDAAALARCVSIALALGGDIGSRTALAPCARERYFENHKVMAVVDKLHKLYASTAPPVVWARSTGLEVLNELDALKAGIVGAAGGRSSARGGASSFWDRVAGGVEMVVGGARVAEAVGSGLTSVAGGILQQIARAASGPKNDRREWKN
ncbi:hypothetical protein EI94DRAFT_1736773 [Lactarius quietus]|nr:hypothetical protein EI94DRAFT_1736773 [Lactarius quietus]